MIAQLIMSVMDWQGCLCKEGAKMRLQKLKMQRRSQNTAQPLAALTGRGLRVDG
jgi:hypothetical protein